MTFPIQPRSQTWTHPHAKDHASTSSPSTSMDSSSSKQSRKFNAGWMRGRKPWLVYCSLCQKYEKRPYNHDICHVAGSTFKVSSATNVSQLTGIAEKWKIQHLRFRVSLVLSVLQYQRKEWSKHSVAYTP